MSDPAAAPSTIDEHRLSLLPGGGAPRRMPLLRMLGEIAFIAIGVFLGLAADQWRERQQHREAARASLQRFRTEISANRQAVLAVKDYHVATLGRVRAYLAKDRKTRNVADVPIRGLQMVFFEHTAWDLALATQSLSYLDGEDAYALSRIYSAQQSYVELSRGMTNAMYLISLEDNFDGFASAANAYFGDLVIMEPKLVAMYDDVLPRIDRALGSPQPATRR